MTARDLALKFENQWQWDGILCSGGNVLPLELRSRESQCDKQEERSRHTE